MKEDRGSKNPPSMSNDREGCSISVDSEVASLNLIEVSETHHILFHFVNFDKIRLLRTFENLQALLWP